MTKKETGPMPLARLIRTFCVVPLACVAVLLLHGGCAEQQPPAPGPLLSAPPPLHATHLPGGPIVRTPPPAAPYDDPVPIRVTWYATDQMPDAPGVSVGGRTRLVIRDRVDSPIRPSAELTRDAVLIENAGPLASTLAAGPPSLAQPIGEVVGLLPRGVTFSTRLDDAAAGPDATADMTAHRYVGLDVARVAATPAPATTRATTRTATAPTGPRLQIGLTVSDTTADQPAVHRETAILDAPVPNAGRPLAIAVPFALADSRASVVVMVVEFAPSGQRAAPPDLVARLGRDLKREAATTRPAGQLILTDAGASASFVTGVFPGLLQEDRQRTSLVFLADSVDAPLTRDVATTADDKTLALLSDRVITKLTDPGATFDRDSVAYALEGTSLGFLAEQQSAQTLPKPLEAVLTIHAGEAARHEGSIEEVLKGARSRADLTTGLTNENIILLSDSSPSARVRAYDWLAARGQAPDGYDPLAPSRQRQTALDQWIERRASATQPATRAATTPTTKS